MDIAKSLLSNMHLLLHSKTGAGSLAAHSLGAAGSPGGGALYQHQAAGCSRGLAVMVKEGRHASDF